MKEASASTVSGQLYPDLGPTNGSNYRLQQINDLKRDLEKERDIRDSLYKKYHRGVNVIDGIDATLTCASLGLGASGIGLLTTVIAAPIVIGLEVSAIVCGLLGIAGKFISKRLQVKAKKHDQIRVLADSKLNTISDHISKALKDGICDDHEFKLILDEIEKYRQMKSGIRNRAQKSYSAINAPNIDEQTKNSLIAQGREEARALLMQKLGGN